MPYKSVWVKPAVFLRHKGVIIYRTYRYDDVDAGTSEYTFTTNPEYTDYKEYYEGTGVFDARELSTFHEPPHPQYIHSSMDDETRAKLHMEWDVWRESEVEERAIKKAIRDAIELGLLQNDGV